MPENSSKHTPGPWEVLHCGIDSETILVQSGDGLEICTTIGEQMGLPEEAANARLIAAAPDMLAACKSALEVLDEACQTGYHDAEKDAPTARELEAAIAKAEGGAA